MSEKFEIWGVKDPNISAQLALALEMDLFKRETGLDVSCKFIESGTTMPRDILEAEQKPFAFVQTPISAILLHEKGFSTKIVAPLADIAGAQQIIVQTSSGIMSPKDLEGKRIGMAKGAAVYMAIVNMAKDCNVDVENIYFINLLPHDQLTGFEDGRLDAVACWEPWTTKARDLGGRFFFSGARSEIPGLEGDVSWLINQSCLIVPDAHLEQEPYTLVAILKVLHEATRLINEVPQEVTPMLAKFFNLPEPELTRIMKQNLYAMTMDNLFRIGVLSFRDFLFETDRVSQKFAEHQLYVTHLLEQVEPSLMTLWGKTATGARILEKDGVYYQEDTFLDLRGAPMRFLLVDDSRVVRGILNQVLEQLGAEMVGEAISGNQAIEMFGTLRPNFVTMDLSMPGLSGVDAVKNILSLDPTVNIIVISGLDLQELREEVFNLGVKMYIPKPFDPEQVARVVRSRLM